ncbi:E3 ubiquitin-protein ligase TRAF7 [Holothuria leucospilota]|uniref:E3 ubiquitin-protein ligase TRAF7 n=1 Tax=Holothuria leucospilota TaxID=206669 RepID=A0A9Q1CBV5_HOLLE|nr:E3 ubiquitin-protein ligase TRAF7 [Holothuria leucospilota]
MQARQDPIFVEPPSSHLYCSLCKAVLRDPVISVACGHTFCRTCLCHEDGTVKVTLCPVDEKHIQNSPVVDNRAILSQVEDLKVYCRNGIKRLNSRNDAVIIENGCPEILPFASVEAHVCEYGEIECPNSELCGKFKKVNGSEQLYGHWEGVITGLQKKIEHLEEYKKEMEECLRKQTSIIESLDEKLSSLEKDVVDNTKKLEQVSNRSKVGSISLNLSRVHRASASFEGSVSSREQWNLPFEFKCIGTLRGHKGAVCCLAIHGDKLYSGGKDCVIKVWNLTGLSKGCIQNLQGHTGEVVSLVAGPAFLYSAALDKSIRRWQYDGSNSDNKVVKNAHDLDICALIMATNLLFSSSKSEVKVWKADSLEVIKVISGLYHWVRALALDPQEEKLYCGSHNTVTVWDATGQFNLKRKLDHSFGSVYSIAVSSQYLIVGTYNKNFLVFDVQTHQLLHTSCDHIGSVTSMVLSPDQNFLVTSCHDLKVRVSI